MAPPTRSRRSFLRLTLRLGAVAGTLPPLQACGGATTPAAPAPRATASSATTSAPAKAGGSLTVGLLGDLNNFDPFALAFANYPMIMNVYDQLIRYSHQMKPLPGLAEKWEISSDGRQLVLSLRKGVKFHSGADCNANAVLKNFERARNKDTGTNLYASTLTISDMQAPDPSTVVVRFDKTAPDMLDVMQIMSISDPASFTNLKKQGVGTGPFKFVEWIPNDHFTLQKNTDYWEKGKPLADKVTFKVFSDVDALVAALQSGTVDVVSSFPPKDYQRLRDQFNVVKGQSGANMYEIRINVSKEPFNKKEVRKALQYAVDRQAIVDKVLFGISEPTVGHFPRSSPAYDPKYDKLYRHDLDKARALLEQAGVKGFKAKMMTTNSYPEFAGMSQILQADLAKIGVKTEIEVLDIAQFTPRVYKGDYEFYFTFSGNIHKYPTRIAVNSIYFPRNNPVWGKSAPEAYVQAIDDANGTLDPTKQKEAFAHLEDVLLDEAWTIPVAWRYSLFAQQKAVKGLDWSVDDMIDVSGVSK